MSAASSGAWNPSRRHQATNRGAALWGNLVISAANYPARIIATDKNTGKVVWETNMVFGEPELRLTSAPLAVKDKIIVGAAGGDRGVRDWIAGLDAATGKVLWRKFTIPAPGEPGSETWKGNTNAWQTGGGAMWVTGTYDPETNQTIWGTGNPVPMFDPFYRPGDNLYTNSAISWDPDTGKMNWYFQYTPGDMWDYDEVGTHILIDGHVAGQPRKLVTHSARNGFLYTMDRNNGADGRRQALYGQRQLDQGHRPEDRQAARLRSRQGHPDLCGRRQPYSGRAAQEGLSVPGRRQQLLAVVLQPQHQADVHPGPDGLRERLDRSREAQAQRGWNGGFSQTDERFESNLTAVDPVTGEIKKSVHLRYPNYSGTLATAGGLVFLGLLDGTVAAYDDTTLDELWKVNVGTGFSAPPMTFEVNGKQYLAIASGLSAPAGRSSSTRRSSRRSATRPCCTSSRCERRR